MLKAFLSLFALLAPHAALAGLTVVTDIPPVQSLVAGVMGQTGAPVLLLRPGTSPHDLALRPSDAAALEAADAVFWIGPALSPMLEKAIATLAVDARRVRLLDVPGTTRLALRDDAALGGEHQHSVTADAGVDPHAWLDPDNGVLWLSVIAETLSGADPANAETYRANAQAMADGVRSAEADARAVLATPPSFALYHDELGYFSHAFGIAASAALSDSEAHVPGPRRRSEVMALLAASRPACIVGSPEISPAALIPLTEASSGRALTLDALTGGQPEGQDLYPGLLLALATSLSTCHR